jgi:hypothetical protein
MRRALLLIPLLFACSKTETAKTDSATMAPPAPAALTEADVAGTWTGTAMMAGTDSVISHWTQVCASGTCKGTSTEAPKDTVTSTYTLMADSAMGVTQPYADPTMKGTKVIDNWTLHVSGGKATGTGKFTLASKPDSVLMNYRFEGTRNP